MLRKKAIELSLNFIVIIIISLILFGFGFWFISTLSSQATELQELTTSELDQRIGDLICEGAERVCVGLERQTIRKKNFGIFGIKMISILEDQNFDIIVSRPSPSGYTKSGEGILSDGLIWNPKQRSIFIEKNEEKEIGIGVEVPADATPGTYIFDVVIQAADGTQYSQVQKLYVEVP